MWNPFKPKELPIVEYQPRLSDMNESGIVNLVEQFKGEIEQNKVKFPAELGEEHPFDFKTLEQLYEKFGFFTAIIDKYVDFIWGSGFFVECKDARATEIIEQFMQDVNFDMLGRAWTKEALMKGNGFMEIGPIKESKTKTTDKKAFKSVGGMKVLDANYMYVDRDKLGKIEGYNQYIGGFNKFEKTKVIPFKPNAIAHLPFNIVGDNAYGLGIGYPAMKLMDNMISQSSNMHFLQDRKANSPLQAKLGRVDGQHKIIPKKTDVDAFGKKMEVMNKKTNWATDDLVDLKVIDFGNVGDKFDAVLEHDLNMLIYAFQVPGVLLGMSNINMGIAKVEMEGFQRRIQSMQANIEKVIEEKIFKRVLEANGLDIHVEFEWGSPSVLQVEGRMDMMSKLIMSQTTGSAMRLMLEDEMVNLFKLDPDEWKKLKLEQEAKEEEERKRLEAQAQPIVPGQNAKFPQKVAPKAEQPKQPKAEQSFKPFIDMMTKQNENQQKALADQHKNQMDFMNKQVKTEQKIQTNMESEDVINVISKIIQNKNTKDIDNIRDEFNKKLEDEQMFYNEKMNELRIKSDTENKINNDKIINMKNEINKQDKKEQELKDKLKKEQKINNDKILSTIKNSETKKIITQLTKEKEENKEQLLKLETKREEDKKHYEEMLRIELENIKKKHKSKRRIKSKLFKKKKGLLPAFRISRKTESYKPKTLKIKRKNECYEHQKECAHCVESWDNYNTIEEWLGFNYKKYLGHIETALAAYDFELVKAITEIELEAGMLSSSQVEELRKVLDNGFKKGSGLKEMAKEVDKKVKPKDLYRMKDGEMFKGAAGLPVLSRSAEKRAIGIVRSEVTRMANAGAVDYYKENGIKQISHVASYGDRTCEECIGLNGTIYEIGREPGLPVHPMCRCTYSPMTELK